MVDLKYIIHKKLYIMKLQIHINNKLDIPTMNCLYDRQWELPMAIWWIHFSIS